MLSTHALNNLILMVLSSFDFQIFSSLKSWNEPGSDDPMIDCRGSLFREYVWIVLRETHVTVITSFVSDTDQTELWTTTRLRIELDLGVLLFSSSRLAIHV